MNDLLKQLAVAIRSVAREGADPDELVRVTLRRSYPTTADDLWDALTAPARIARWMTPISGDLTVAGTFQLEGNAGGEILACEPPRLLRATWGDASSIVSVVLAPVGPEETELELSHTVPVALAGSVAGALFVGPGWDEALLGLAEYLDGRPPVPPSPTLPRRWTTPTGPCCSGPTWSPAPARPLTRPSSPGRPRWPSSPRM